MSGTLYLVATPIGNLGDFSPGQRKHCERWTSSPLRTPVFLSAF